MNDKVTRFEASRRILWRPIAFYITLAFIVAFPVLLGFWHTREIKDLPAWLALWSLSAVVLIGPTVPVWWWRAARTVYEISEGELKVTQRPHRGQVNIPFRDIDGLRVEGALTWGNLFIPFSTDGGILPRAILWTGGERVDLSPILLWGPRAPREMERALRAAAGLRLP